MDQLNQIASKNGLIIVENEEPDGDGSLWDLRDRELETVILSFSEHQLRQMFEMAQLIEFEECDLAGLGLSLTV
ncbi:MAG: hypothetical protein KTR35_05885 [Gammaproteobacteria bacterium]|nr:hypothetical protein [Gammaproteobacteria bacterium]